MDYCVITFESTQGAILAQKLLEGVCPVQVMPVLREISKGCGISVRFAPEHLDAVRTALASSPLSPGEYGFYGVTGGGKTLSTRPLS